MDVGQLVEHPGHLAVRARRDHGHPVVAALAQSRTPAGPGPGAGTPSSPASCWPPAGAEQLVALPVVAGEPAHVLDDPPHGELQLAGGVGGTLGHPLGRRLRRGHHVDLGLGQVLAQRQGDVTGARRHVDQQVVGLAPVGVDQELLEGLVQHRAPPDHRGVVGDEVAHRQAADAVGRRGHHQVADDQRIGGDPEHPRHREPVDVGVEDPDVMPHAGPGPRPG